MSIHPSRQAYVEEGPEVSLRQPFYSMVHVHTPSVARCSSMASVEVEEKGAWADTVSLRRKRSTSAMFVSDTTSSSHLSGKTIPSNTSTATDTNYAIPSTGPGQQSKQASTILNDFRRKREAAAIAVPTDDKRVRADLRSRGEPITLFGERPEDRRDRLRGLLYAEQQGDEDESMQDATPAADEEEEEIGEFYTEGSQELLAARREIAKYSLPRTARRIARQRIESTIPVAAHVQHRKAIKERLSGFELFGSQIASERPVSMVRVSPDNQRIACGDWGGSLKLLDIPNLETKTTLRGHKGMISGIAWYPTEASSTLSNTVALASGGGEGDVNLWSVGQDTPLSTLSGHTARVCRTEFHPSGRYLASASYDTTWRLWDLESTTELLLQEGHSKEVYSVSFNLEGSLLASAGLDSIGRVWDLRTGRTVMLLESHVAPIFGVDWGTDGVRVLTGSSDGFAKCWDLRAVRETASIGAHKGGVSDLRWFKGTDGLLSQDTSFSEQDVTMTNGGEEANPSTQPKKAGTFFVSAGFDKAVNIFSADDWALCKSLTGHDGTVLSCDVTSDAKWIASCGRDRTVKLWARDDMEGI
jgi:U4/U6 small nuclear ribonucleoprotein PRP4